VSDENIIFSLGGNSLNLLVFLERIGQSASIAVCAVVILNNQDTSMGCS
jgi:hypothetical protein